MSGQLKGMRQSIEAHRFHSADHGTLAQLIGGDVTAADVETAEADGCPAAQPGRLGLLQLLAWLLVERRHKPKTGKHKAAADSESTR